MTDSTGSSDSLVTSFTSVEFSPPKFIMITFECFFSGSSTKDKELPRRFKDVTLAVPIFSFVGYLSVINESVSIFGFFLEIFFLVEMAEFKLSLEELYWFVGRSWVRAFDSNFSDWNKSLMFLLVFGCFPFI